MNFYKKSLFLFLATCTLLNAQNSEKPFYTNPKWENPEWENPEIFQINREKPTASFYRYSDATSALKNDNCDYFYLIYLFVYRKSRFL